MLLTLRSDHKEHLSLLIDQPTQILIDFCKLTLDYIQNGPNEHLYANAAKKLEASETSIQNTIHGIIFLILESCRHRLSETDFRDSVLLLGFDPEQEQILSKFYESKRSVFNDALSRISLSTPHYHSLKWRLEIQLAARSLQQQVTPLIAMELTLENRPNSSDFNSASSTEKILMQTDPTTLVHITETLEQALQESRGQHFRRIQRTYKQ